MNKYFLEIKIDSLLYSEIAHSHGSLTNYTAYGLLYSQLNIHKVGHESVKIKILDIKENVLIMKLSVGNIVDFITVNNEFSAFIVNLDMNDSDRLSSALCDNRDSKDLWNKYIAIAYKRIKSDPAYNKGKWEEIDVYSSNEEFIIDHDRGTIQVYAKLNEKGEALLGFSLRPHTYDYFTDKITTNIYYDEIKTNERTIEQCKLYIDNKEYYIDITDKMNGTLKLYADLYNNAYNFGFPSIANFETNSCAIKTSSFSGLSTIIFSDTNKDKIELIDNLGNTLKVSELITKINTMGIKEFEIGNTKLYNYIPTESKASFEYYKLYDYVLSFKDFK